MRDYLCHNPSGTFRDLLIRGRALHGLDGKEVKRIEPGRSSSVSRALVWDGTDDAGNRVPAGTYVPVKTSRPKNRTKVV